MKLIDILRNRASDDKFEKEICTALCSKADEIITQASAHLEYVRNVLPEFDMHNVKHSEGVLQIIEDLLGEDAEKLSSYDLFSLIAVAYLHDCGMAVSDAEINVMKLVENEEFDGKKVCTVDEAINVIECNKNNIFKTEKYAEEIKNWLFYPGSEEKLFDFYAELLRDYQSFRNGKTDVIKKSTDLNQTNKALRLEYIRCTHADRAEIYINTWGDTNYLEINNNKQAGKKLSQNIAKACKAHGCDANYIKKLETTIRYSRKESSNVQFVAMMLRIGDLAHFDYRRAPIVLRALHQFESDYSYEQWRIKEDSGVEIWGEPGQIYCQAFCDSPKDYYNLTSYVDYIDHELELYNKLKYGQKWGEQYPSMNEKVDRNGLQWDKDLFTPVPNLKFTLEQNKILDLLMGAELYSDEYACLRELYQNSLDACRCQISKDKSKGKDSKGEIEFGLADENGERYVYCLDNGKGMSKHIIENYLLKIGSSYYKSSDFNQSQAETGNTFTPTSQFGIGILSCFMIGDRVEITTREDGGDYISCVMENIHECFYYKKETPPKDQDAIPSSGTLVKIFLNAKYKEKISNEHLDNIGYLLWRNEHAYYEDRNHLNHLYFILDGFVKMVPDNIILNVQIKGESELLPIYNKPLLMGEGICTFPHNDDYRLNIKTIEKLVFKDLDVEHEGIRYRSYLILPTDSMPFYNYQYLDDDFLLGCNACCVDGITVDFYFVDYAESDMLEVFESFRLGGVLNFIGTERPQLSVSREKIVKYNPEKYEGKIKVLLGKIVKQAIDKIAGYIAEKNVEPDSEFYMDIWNAFFMRFKDVPANIIAQHLTGESIKDLVMPLPKAFFSNQMTFGDLWEKNMRFDNYRMFISNELMTCPKLLKQIISYRIKSSTSITFDGNNVSITGYHPNEVSEGYYIPTDDGLFQNYDIVASLYPFVSNSLEKLDQKIPNFLYDYVECFWEVVMCVDSKFSKILIIAMHDFISIQVYKMRINERGDNPEIYSLLTEFFNKNRNQLLNNFISIRFPYEHFKIGYQVFTFYIPISKEQLEKGPLEEYKKYYHRLFNAFDNDTSCDGLSVVLFGNDDYYVLPGRWTRQQLIDMIPNDFWEKLPDIDFHFADGTPVRRSK